MPCEGTCFTLNTGRGTQTRRVVCYQSIILAAVGGGGEIYGVPRSVGERYSNTGNSEGKSSLRKSVDLRCMEEGYGLDLEAD